MPRLWLVNQYANTPEMPGHTRHYDIVNGLRKYNWEVDVFASDFNLSQRSFKKLKRFQLIYTESINGSKWHWLRVSPYKKNHLKRILNLISFCIAIFINILFKFLVNSTNKKQPDVFLASSPQLPAAFTTFLLAKILSKPFILEVRDLWPQVLIDQGGKNPNSIEIKILALMEKILYKYSSALVVLSKGSENYLKVKGAGNIFWLPNGPDLKKFKFSELPEERFEKGKRRLFKILYAGAHGEANDLSNIVKTAKILIEFPIEFTFIGDGPLKFSLMKESKGFKNIIFKEPIPKKLIPNYMSKFDAILLSLNEVSVFKYGVSPNKLYDAYALGRPVISTALGDVNNEIEEYNLGVTAPPNNPNLLAESIKTLIKKSRKERESMAFNARKIAEEIYSREKIIRKYNDLLRSIIKNDL